MIKPTGFPGGCLRKQQLEEIFAWSRQVGTDNQGAASGLSLLGKPWSREADVQQGLKDQLAQKERFTKKTFDV